MKIQAWTAIIVGAVAGMLLGQAVFGQPQQPQAPMPPEVTMTALSGALNACQQQAAALWHENVALKAQVDAMKPKAPAPPEPPKK